MTERHFSLSLPVPTAQRRKSGANTSGIELQGLPTGHARFNAQVNRRRSNNQAVIENPLAHLTDEELVADVYHFQQTYLRSAEGGKLLRAARVAKDIRTYDEVARADNLDADHGLPVQLNPEEKAALRAEKDVLFSEPGMFRVILAVSLAAFLQGFVQTQSDPLNIDNWKFGAMNASPFLSASLIGCWLSLPINDRFGRRGAMAVAACLIFGSSLGSAFCRSWIALFLVRIVNGIGMGIKAVSTPILASETAVGFWRGSSILAWQLWVAFGIMLGFAFNLIFWTAGTGQETLTLGLILGAPLVPSLFLLVGLYYCPESPRYYMPHGSSNFNPAKAYAILRKLRKTELQALRDIYLVYKSVQLEEYAEDINTEDQTKPSRRGFFSHLAGYLSQLRELFTARRLRNALISSATVALAQQLCGSAINFIFGLPAIRTIDTLGRRKWLTMTLPVIFPLSHREIGCAFAVATNFLFAGLLSMFYPSINHGLGDGRSLGLFAGLNLVAFVLVFLLVEETKRRSLEDLDLIFAVQKRTFIRHQVTKYLPWFLGHYILGRRKPQPSLYLDLIWGAHVEGRQADEGYSATHDTSPVSPRTHAWYPVPLPEIHEQLSRASSLDTDDTHA
ncbi:and other transporter-domain-containing protein [Pseudomassariella vexata]|uniref:And other transporter-domain-containing protein n=1 Tax=Pseudomassariella vexata TaxID=1141098 RepID=A0A1Y2DTR3_9PEZI|nr:and other transporter-domain-containing protein [Pseudomassariella vexata]ORY62682.1 and other transporter-domain-containing protein [Pseudomassariella vexata]